MHCDGGGVLAGVGLEEGAQEPGVAPDTLEVVEPGLSRGGVDDHGVAPARGLHEQPRGRAREQFRGAGDGLGPAEAPAGSSDRLGVADLGVDLDDV